MASKKDDKPITLKILNQAVDTILNTMQAMFDDQNKRFGKLDSSTSILKKDLIEAKSNIKWIKNDTEGILSELTTYTPKSEHNKLKTRVAKLEKVRVN